MTDPAIMRLSKDQYEKRVGPVDAEDKTGTEWFDRIIDHKFIEIDVGHKDQSNFDLGTPPAPAGVCLFDNNLSDTILFQSSVYKDNIAGYDPSLSSTYIGEDNSHEAGPMYGHNAEDTVCLGDVCLESYPFYYATAQTWWDFRLDDDGGTSQNYVGGICGLGKELPTKESRSFLARAEDEGLVADNVYAVNMSPHKYGKSYLTIGGYYDFDYKGDLFWYAVPRNAKEWSLKVPSIKLGDSEYYPSVKGDLKNAGFKGNFQTGYPYIGLPEGTFEQVKYHFMRYFTSL